jgi:anti-sigma factor RsiW
VSGVRSGRDEIRRRMMAALDGELDPAGREQLDRTLAGDPSLREEWERLRRVREVMETMTLRRPSREVWDTYWTSVYNRIERSIGWVLTSIGAAIVLGWGAWQAIESLLADTTVPVFVKIGLLALAVGAAVLLVSVVREKWFTRGKDPYREVER